MNNDIRNLQKWLNEEQETPIDRQALARVLAMAEQSQQEPVACERCLELERLCDATYVAQGADAYNHACDEMERWQQTRQKEGKEVGTTGSLCDGISWLYGHIDELEAKVATPPAQRTWAGLTEIEAADCWSSSTVRTWQAIEAKLKEKNA